MTGDTRIVDITDVERFERIPPCADGRFDHRSCDYWEDADRGSKAARVSWLVPAAPRAPAPGRPAGADDPFAPASHRDSGNPFAAARPSGGGGGAAAFRDLFGDDGEEQETENPFAPRTVRERPATSGVPRKLALLDRGRGVFGSYAKVLEVRGTPAAYAQFGPLSAYPRALRLRELYPHLPASPLPAVITCIATTLAARRNGYAAALINDVCGDLAERGFAAVEAYPDLTRSEDETSAGRPGLWLSVGFHVAVDDERFPVMRRELE